MTKKKAVILRLFVLASLVGGLTMLFSDPTVVKMLGAFFYFIVAAHCYAWLVVDNPKRGKEDLVKLQLLVFLFPGPYATALIHLIKNRARPIIPIGKGILLWVGICVAYALPTVVRELICG